jgi:hypothetical protein
MKGHAMKTLGRMGLFVAALSLIAAAAQAEESRSPKAPPQRKASEEAQLAAHAKSANKECGSSMTVKFDWRGVHEKDLSTYSASGWCDALLEGIRRVCTDAPGKDAVKEKIKSVTCGFGPDRAISLKDGALDYKISFKSVNDADFAYEALENAL